MVYFLPLPTILLSVVLVPVILQFCGSKANVKQDQNSKGGQNESLEKQKKPKKTKDGQSSARKVKEERTGISIQSKHGKTSSTTTNSSKRMKKDKKGIKKLLPATLTGKKKPAKGRQEVVEIMEQKDVNYIDTGSYVDFEKMGSVDGASKESVGAN